ncbi:MAG: hypothetical protein BWY89_01321 [Bacteroidetes bacterium ADurb.BinA012]|nr:MAG: hypothetical protein BWY89_01321 [Bacteroidetes bacterium ADurb.BinA012]
MVEAEFDLFRIQLDGEGYIDTAGIEYPKFTYDPAVTAICEDADTVTLLYAQLHQTGSEFMNLAPGLLVSGTFIFLLKLFPHVNVGRIFFYVFFKKLNK